jgi:hypothetical protein
MQIARRNFSKNLELLAHAYPILLKNAQIVTFIYTISALKIPFHMFFRV